MTDQPNLGGDPDAKRPENRGVTGSPIPRERIARAMDETSDEHRHWTPADDVPPVEPERKRWSMATIMIVALGVLCVGVVVAIVFAGIFAK
jgi:hypothetical protein